MRSPQKSNRARGRGGRKPNGNILNRVFESAGPDGKVRGTPQQIVDKYLALARDAQTSGDRVKAENFLQHAEHYQRIILEAMAQREQRREPHNPAPEAPAQQQAAAPRAEGEAVEPTAGADPVAAPVPAGNGGDPAQDVSGLATIDPVGGEAQSLLVETREAAGETPARRRRSRGNGQGAARQTGGDENPAE